ncbi:MAG: methyltransferase domain-containing protein [Actinobacteria bacterium]|nr:methyltransferase domain-containing protein [Actinomycetota bacterium]
MTSCCRAGPCEQIFKPRLARKSLERHRKKGLDDLEQRMIAAASTGGLDGARVLEIGGGIGTMQSELLAAGAANGEIVELVAAWEPYARELARERGFEERTSFRVADVLESPESVEDADVVLLNRVVCCSPDGIALASRAARLTRSTLVLSFPRDVVWVRMGLRLVNLGMRVIGRSFRVFLHPPADLVSSAEATGLTLVESGTRRMWAFAALCRET